MDTVPTVTINTPAGPTLINASDYDEAKHGAIIEGYTPTPSELPAPVPETPPVVPNFGVAGVPPVPPVVPATEPPPVVPPAPPIVATEPPPVVPPVPATEPPAVGGGGSGNADPAELAKRSVTQMGKNWFIVNGYGDKVPGFAPVGYTNMDKAIAAMQAGPVA